MTFKYLYLFKFNQKNFPEPVKANQIFENITFFKYNILIICGLTLIEKVSCLQS